jgi:hypothetical protein
VREHPKIELPHPLFAPRARQPTAGRAELSVTSEPPARLGTPRAAATITPARSASSRRSPPGGQALTNSIARGHAAIVKRSTAVTARIALAVIAVVGVVAWRESRSQFLCPYSSPIGGPSACSGPLTTSLQAWIQPRSEPGDFTISVRNTGTAPISPTCQVDGFDAQGNRVGHGEFPLSKLPVDFPHAPPGTSPGTVVDAGPAFSPGTKIRFGPVPGTRVFSWSGDEIMSFYGHLGGSAPVASFKVSCTAH